MQISKKCKFHSRVNQHITLMLILINNVIFISNFLSYIHKCLSHKHFELKTTFFKHHDDL
mgnify:CR=1 FL=1